MSLQNCFSSYDEHIIVMFYKNFPIHSTIINDGNSGQTKFQTLLSTG